MNTIDLKTLLKYANQYIALKKDRSSIIASGTSIKELEDALRRMRIKNAIVSYIPPADKSISPVCQK